MIRAKITLLTAIGMVSFFAVSVIIPATKTYAANTGDVVINELMYNPVSDNQNEEFLELYNTTGSTINLENWCFTDGISLCFTAGAEIAANDYIVISPDAAQTLSTYSVTTEATYTSALSNGGETVELQDNLGNVISSVSYTDDAPWPVTPDGTGPSLELTDSLLDINLASSWAASLNSGGTPGQENSTAAVSLPRISNVTRPIFVDASTATVITAEVENVDTVELVYKVMFEADVTVTMNDDGLSGDGASGDGVYGATIPGQDAGELVRFRIDTENVEGPKSAPGNDDTFNYYPFIVNDGQTSDLPIVRWYMDPADYTDMTTNHLTDDEPFPAVVAVGDQIFDNATVNVKGQSSVDFPKKKFKFNLPQGHLLGSPVFEHEVDEFAIQVYFLNFTDLQEAIGWRALNEFGFPELQNRYIRAHRNTVDSPTDFIGHYLLIENYDGKWRDREGYEEGALYKQGNDKKTRLDEDTSDIDSLVSNLTTLEGNALKNYLLDNLDIPKIVNYHAVSAAIMHTDWFFGKNIYQYRDTEGTGRWSYLPWDIDNAMVPSTFNSPQNGSGILKYPIAGEWNVINDNSTQVYYDDAHIEQAMYQFPEFREMFFRRSMNVYDQIFTNDRYLEWFDEYFTLSEETLADDLTEWNDERKTILTAFFPDGLPYDIPDDFPYPELDPDNFFDYLETQTPAMMRELYIYGIGRHKNQVEAMRSSGELLLQQKANEEKRLQISELHYNPSGNDMTEFIEIYNNSDKPVDISGWQLQGVGFTFEPGTVLPGKTYGVIVKNDTAFRATYPSVLVMGQYNGNLSNTGETLRLLDSSNTTRSQVTYKTNGEWPDQANGQGYTLGIIRTNVNETLASCWAYSASLGGTPGSSNTLNQTWVDQYSGDCQDRQYGFANIFELVETGAKAYMFISVGSALIFSTIIITRHSQRLLYKLR